MPPDTYRAEASHGGYTALRIGRRFRQRPRYPKWQTELTRLTLRTIRTVSVREKLAGP